MIKEVSTLCRAVLIDESIHSLVGRLNPSMISTMSEIGNSFQYAYFEPNNPYLLMLSQSLDKSKGPSGGNTLLTVNSYSNERNVQVLRRVEEQSDVEFNLELPRAFRELYESGGRIVFPVFVVHPERAMKFLRERRL